MAKVLFSAASHDGSEESGYIEAGSNRDALRKLKEMGLKQIRLYSDASIDIDDSVLDMLDEKGLQEVAKEAIEGQKKELSDADFMRTLLRSSALPALVGAAMFYYGFMHQGALWMAFGVIVASFVPFWSLWHYRIARAFESLQKKFVLGEWDEVERIGQKLHRMTRREDVRYEADFKQAYALARTGGFEEAKALLEKHRDFMAQRMPGMYENALGQLSLASERYADFLENMQEAYRVGKSDLLHMDWVMAELLLGDVDVAERELGEIEREALPVFAQPIVGFAEGLIAFRREKFEEAAKLLEEANEGLRAFVQNPVLWIPIATVRGVLAMVYHDLGRMEEAEALLDEAVVRILQTHLNPFWYRELATRFPDTFPARGKRG